MKIKSYKHVYLTIVIFVAVLLGYRWFADTQYFREFYSWSQQNLIISWVVLVSLKILGIVIPPLPGGIFTLGAIPLIGWKAAYLADFLGSLVGSSIAYTLGKKYGYAFLEKIFDQATIDRIKKIKVSPGRELECVVALRVLGGTIVEAVCYGAGLLKIQYRNFLIGSIFSHLLYMPVYYLALNIFETKNLLASGIMIVVYVFIFSRIKGRYFE